MPLNIPQYESLVDLIPFINMGQEYRIPVTERAKQMEAAESVRGGVGDFDPTGLTPLSVRSFAKLLDPDLVKNLAGGRTGTKKELYNLTKAYMEKYDLLSPNLTAERKEKLLNAMVDTLGAQGLQGVHGLIKARSAGKIKDAGPHYGYHETEFPFLQFDIDRVARAWWPERVPTKNPQGAIRAKVTGTFDTTNPFSNFPTVASEYWEALSEELAHQTTGANIRRSMYDPVKVALIQTGGISQGVTPVDKAIVDLYARNPVNKPWKLFYEGPNRPETNVAEFVEQHIRPAYMPRRAKIAVGTRRNVVAHDVAEYAEQKPEYWQMWEREPEIFQKVHELLDLPIPKSVRRKRQLGEFALTPEDKADIALWLKAIERAKQNYRNQVLGKPATQPIPPGSP